MNDYDIIEGKKYKNVMIIKTLYIKKRKNRKNFNSK